MFSPKTTLSARLSLYSLGDVAAHLRDMVALTRGRIKRITSEQTEQCSSTPPSITGGRRCAISFIYHQ